MMPASYLPCTKSLNDLEPMLIQDMRLETHHREKKVFLRAITPPDRINAVMTIVEDTSGLTVLLQLYHLPEESLVPAELVVWEGCVCIIKEPFFKATVDGSYSLRVDHVSDIVWLSDDSAQVPSQWKAQARVPRDDSPTIRSQGNDAVENEQWARAAQLYTSAVQAARTEDEAKLARLNRSLVNLKLGRFEAALADAKEHGKASLEKALFREGRALYELGRHKESLSKLLTMSELFPENTAYKPHSKFAQERLLEAHDGKYNFARMYKQAQKQGSIIDCATFSKPVEIRDSPGRGRGLFTTRAVSAGDLLLCEKAIRYCDAGSSSRGEGQSLAVLVQIGSSTGYVGGQAGLITDLVQKLEHNPVSTRPFLDLHYEDYETSSVAEVDGHPVVDTFRVMQIVTTNCFGAPRTSLETLKTCLWVSKAEDVSAYSTCGIWPLASRINHSCVGNCRRSFIGDMMIIRATCDVPEGTELRFPYKPARFLSTYDEAQRELKKWKFECDCPICLNKKTTTQEELNKRKGLLSRLKLYLKPDDNKLTVAQFQSVRDILEKIEASYKSSRSSSDTMADELCVPRLAVWDPYFALGAMSLEVGKQDQAAAMTVKGLEALSFNLVAPSPRGHQPHKQSGVLKINSWGLVNEYVPTAFLFLFRAYRATDPEAAAAAKGYLKIAYQIVVGESETILETFPELR